MLNSEEITRLTSVSLGVEEVDFLKEGGLTRNAPGKNFTLGRKGIDFLEDGMIPRRNPSILEIDVIQDLHRSCIVAGI